MHEIFHIRAFCSPNGTFREVELDLPATDYELLDLMDQLQPEDSGQICLEIHAAEEYDYLDNKTREPGLLQLNALAKRLAELDIQGMAAFEGLVCMDLQKGEKTIPVPLLIDYSHSGDICHVVGDAMTDAALGRFLAENDFIPEAESLSDAAFELLDFQRIGKTHREAEGGAFTGFGYVERHSELHHVSAAMDFQPRKPPYMVLLNIAPFPNTGTPEASPEPVPIQLPASGAELQRVLERLKKPDWKGVMAAILDCPVPSMNKDIFLEENIPQVIEWAEALRTLDEAGCLHKYKALLKAEDCAEVTEALRLAGPLEEYEFDSALHTEEDVAAAFLTKNISGDLLEKILPHINLWQLGAGLLEASNGALTPYGAITRKDGQPFQIMNDQPGQGGMEMN